MFPWRFVGNDGTTPTVLVPSSGRGKRKKRKLKRKTQPNRDTGAESGKRYPFRHGPWLGYQMFLGSLTGLKTGTGNEIPTASQELTLVPTWIAVDSFAYRPQGFKRLS